MTVDAYRRGQAWSYGAMTTRLRSVTLVAQRRDHDGLDSVQPVFGLVENDGCL